MERLFALLMKIRPMSPDLIKYLEGALQAFEFKARQVILRKGQVSNHIYFVGSGIVRCYFEDDQEKQTNLWFMEEGNVIVAVESFFNRTPSDEVIVALEDCILYGISYDQLYEAYEKFIEFNFHGRELTTRYYVWSMQRVRMMQHMRASEKYEYTKKTQPGIVDRVPARHLASYLGFDEATLSRIKNGHIV